MPVMSESALPLTHPKKHYALVIFDMDGTLTQERLDFGAIRREIGVPDTSPILEHILSLPAEERRRAETILHRHEAAAAQTCIVRKGALEILAALKERGLRTALLTRNSDACTHNVLARHGLALDYVATRDHTPHKPHRDSIWNILRHFSGPGGAAGEESGISAEQTLMVGDYLYDVQAAANAGVDSVLLCEKAVLPAFAAQATYVVRCLQEVLEIALGTWDAAAWQRRHRRSRRRTRGTPVAVKSSDQPDTGKLSG
jgi:phosphoglycolate phosphatase-like HAD superfamily hydrolase